VPYVIDRYRFKSAEGGPPELRVQELPLNHSVVDFEEDHLK